MHYLYGVFNHLQPIRHWARMRGAQVNLSTESFVLTISREGRKFDLYPRFLIRTEDGQTGYTHVFSDRCRFVGWLPYQMKRWPIATDKLHFKEYCEAKGLRSTKCWVDGPALTEDFIVKPRNGSWGRGICGPFHARDLAALRSTLPPEAFFEQFIFGRPTKIWYWGAEPVAIETVTPPSLVGDGKRTLAEIAGSVRGSFDKSFTLDACLEMLAWQGYTPQSVLPAGERAVLGFLYASDFEPLEVHDKDTLAKESPALRSELASIGVALQQGILADSPQYTLYTVDAVFDKNGLLWLLEMNCHPIVHPNTYRYMLP